MSFYEKLAAAFEAQPTFTFAIGKEAGDLSARWDEFPVDIIVAAATHGFKQKSADSHSDVKRDDPKAATLAREAAEDAIDAMKRGLWTERTGRAADPITKHARTIATLAAQALFKGLVMTKDKTSVKAGSPADQYLVAMAKARGVARDTLDAKEEWTKFVAAKMRDESVLAQARARAEEDKQAEDGLSVDQLKALGLV